LQNSAKLSPNIPLLFQSDNGRPFHDRVREWEREWEREGLQAPPQLFIAARGVKHTVTASSGSSEKSDNV